MKTNLDNQLIKRLKRFGTHHSVAFRNWNNASNVHILDKYPQSVCDNIWTNTCDKITDAKGHIAQELR